MMVEYSKLIHESIRNVISTKILKFHFFQDEKS